MAEKVARIDKTMRITVLLQEAADKTEVPALSVRADKLQPAGLVKAHRNIEPER